MMNRSERPDKGTIVYVGGLAETVKKEDLEVEFEKFGKLNRVWVAFNPPGFAFIEFENKEDAESAVNTLHDATILNSKLRVEISRGRARGGRGGMSGRGSDRGMRGGRGSPRGGGLGSFRGGDFPGPRGGGRGDFGRGRGMRRERGGFGGSFDRMEDFKPFRGVDVGGRYDDFEERRRPFDNREFGSRRDFGGIDSPRGYAQGRDFPSRDVGGRDFASRDAGPVSDYPIRDLGGRDFPSRDVGGRPFPPRDVAERDYVGGRDVRSGRDFEVRDYGVEREMNGTRAAYGGNRDLGGAERDYAGARDYGGARDFGANPSFGGRDFGVAREGPPPARDIGGGRDFGITRDIGMRRDDGIRDFNPPRDLENPRDFGGRPSRLDYAEGDRFGGGGRGGFGNGDVRRAGAFDSGRFSGGDVGGTGDFGGYGARDRFRSRSPIGRVSRPY